VVELTTTLSATWAAARATRLGEFSRNGRLFSSENYWSCPHFCATFSQVHICKLRVIFWQWVCWATFLAIFSPAHTVTLVCAARKIHRHEFVLTDASCRELRRSIAGSCPARDAICTSHRLNGTVMYVHRYIIRDYERTFTQEIQKSQKRFYGWKKRPSFSMTRSGEFSHVWRLFTRGGCLKITEVSNIFGHLCH
jgi:hypothetical protein